MKEDKIIFRVPSDYKDKLKNVCDDLEISVSKFVVDIKLIETLDMWQVYFPYIKKRIEQFPVGDPIPFRQLLGHDHWEILTITDKEKIHDTLLKEIEFGVIDNLFVATIDNPFKQIFYR
jgi:hypothetical protein